MIYFVSSATQNLQSTSNL